jgi:hypothetical protein
MNPAISIAPTPLAAIQASRRRNGLAMLGIHPGHAEGLSAGGGRGRGPLPSGSFSPRHVYTAASGASGPLRCGPYSPAPAITGQRIRAARAQRLQP